MPSTDRVFSSDTHRKYNVKFLNDVISTTVTHDDYTVDRWTEKILENQSNIKKLIVGLSIEYRPTRPYNPRPPIPIIQLCVCRRCLIYQFGFDQQESISRALTDFLDDEDFKFVGIGIRDDVEKLDEDYGLKVRDDNMIDLRQLAVEKNDGDDSFGDLDLKEMAVRVLGKELEKPENIVTSDWSRPFLSKDQVQFACLDAFLSFEIGKALMSR